MKTDVLEQEVQVPSEQTKGTQQNVRFRLKRVVVNTVGVADRADELVMSTGGACCLASCGTGSNQGVPGCETVCGSC